MRSLRTSLIAGLIALALASSALGVAFASSGSNSGSSDRSGSNKGSDKTDTPAATPPAEAPTDNSGPGNENSGSPNDPVSGEKVKGGSEHGSVKVKVPGSDKLVDLEKGADIPMGSLVDARNGSVRLTAPGGQWAVFSGSLFQVSRSSGGRRPVTTLKLRGGDFSSCGVSKPAAYVAARRRAGKPVRGLWAHGKGNFRTRGRNGAATVRGTTWYTADTCKGTLVKVKHGKVAVRDFGRRISVLVRAGEHYLARALERPSEQRRSSQ